LFMRDSIGFPGYTKGYCSPRNVSYKSLHGPVLPISFPFSPPSKAAPSIFQLTPLR
jgi:hypothetical protein